MPKVKYIGTSHYREITAADFKALGVEGQGKVVWDRDNLRQRKDAHQVNEITQEALDWLMANETGNYEKVEDGPPQEPMTGTGGVDQPVVPAPAPTVPAGTQVKGV